MMFSPRWRKVRRDLLLNKTRTILVVLSIAVGVFATGAIATARIVLDRDLARSYAATQPANALLSISNPVFGNSAAGFNDELVESVRRMRSVRDAEGRRRLGVRLQVGPDQWRDLQLIAISDYDAMRINKIHPERGSWPPPKHAMLIERSSLGLMGAQLGDRVLVRTPEGKERYLELAGLVHDSSQLPSSIEGWAYGYVTFDTIEWLGQERTYNELYIVTEQHENRAQVQAIAEQVRDKVEKSGQTVLLTLAYEPGEHVLHDTLAAILLLLSVMGTLALLLSASLVINTVAALMAQQVRHIGIMKSFGARSSQLLGLYVALVMSYGVLALLVALPIGALCAWAFIRLMGHLLNFDLTHFYVPSEALLLEVAVALLVPLLAALAPIIKGTRMSVRAALSDYGLGQGRFGSTRIDRLVERIRIVSRPLLLALRNSVRRKGRLALTVATLTLSGAMFITVLSLHASLLTTLDDLMQLWQWDVWVTLDQPYRTTRLQQEIAHVPGVERADGIGLITTRRVRSDASESDSILLFGVPATSDLLRPAILEGRWLLSGDERGLIITTDVLKDEPDLRVGDAVVLKVEGRETPWRIVGIARGQLAPIMFATAESYARVVREPGEVRALWIRTEKHDAATQARVARALESRFDQQGIRVGSITLLNDERAEAEAAFGVLVALLVFMTVLLALVGGLGLMGTMSLNVVERTREIGVMRAIGAANGTVIEIVLGEGVLIGLVSWLLAVPLAWPLSLVLADAVGRSFLNAPLSYTFSFSGMLLWLIIVVVLSALASLLPAWNAVRVSVRDVLAYE